jgi:hypothetical protein
MVMKNWQSGFVLVFLSGLVLLKKIVPNEFQLTTTISLISGQDTLVDVYQVPLSCFFLSQQLSVPRWKEYVKDMVQALKEEISTHLLEAYQALPYLKKITAPVTLKFHELSPL